MGWIRDPEKLIPNPGVKKNTGSKRHPWSFPYCDTLRHLLGPGAGSEHSDDGEPAGRHHGGPRGLLLSSKYI